MNGVHLLVLQWVAANLGLPAIKILNHEDVRLQRADSRDDPGSALIDACGRDVAW